MPRVTIMNGKKRKRKEIINEVVDDKGYLSEYFYFLVEYLEQLLLRNSFS